jgi:preprotein translocase subunit SecA
MRIFQGDRVKMLMTRLGVEDDMPIQTRSISRTLESAQKRIEGFNFDSRKNVVQYDNVINRHRKVVYMMRRKILMGDDIHSEIERLMRDETKALTEFSSRVNKDFDAQFKAVFDFDDDLIHEIGLKRKEKEREKSALEAVNEAYARQEEKFGSEVMRKVEREVYLKVLDMLWMQHLENMQHLREGIHWRSVGQRDPLVEYRSESQKLFDGLQRTLREEVMHILLSIKQQDVAEVSDDKYDTELTKMAESATEKGVNEISAGEKNMDNEFSKDEHGITKDTTKTPAAMRTGGKNTNKNAKRNAARKNKKKARQNKKKGRR